MVNRFVIPGYFASPLIHQFAKALTLRLNIHLAFISPVSVPTQPFSPGW
jgi:hypothetical protein